MVKWWFLTLFSFAAVLNFYWLACWSLVTTWQFLKMLWFGHPLYGCYGFFKLTKLVSLCGPPFWPLTSYYSMSKAHPYVSMMATFSAKIQLASGTLDDMGGCGKLDKTDFQADIYCTVAVKVEAETGQTGSAGWFDWHHLRLLLVSVTWPDDFGTRTENIKLNNR